jgi:hypothetical protein
MWTFGRFVVLTHDEVQAIADEARARGYHAGLNSKWRVAKKNFMLPPPPGEQYGEITDLLTVAAPGVAIPQRETGLTDFLSRNAEECTSTQGPTSYGDSLPLPNRNAETYDEGHEEESQFNVKESEAEDAA